MRAVLMPGRTLRQLAATAAVAVSLALAATSTAAAHGSVYPEHTLQGTTCNDWGFRVRPPSLMRSWSGSEHISTMEEVWWSVDILRWNVWQQRWKKKLVGDWNYAFATGRGLVPDMIQGGTSWHYPNGTGFLFVDYTIPGHGLYKIKHYLQWIELGNTDYQHVQTGRDWRCRK